MVWIASIAEEIPSALCHQHEIQGTRNIGIRLSRFTNLLKSVGIQIHSQCSASDSVSGCDYLAVGSTSTTAAQYPFPYTVKCLVE